MRYSLYLFAFLICLNFSCSEDSEPIEACATDNVLEDLPWLVERIEELEKSDFGQEYSFISKGTYQSQTVFIFQNCCPNCNSVFTVQDCSGNSLGTFGTGGIQTSEVTDMTVIWKSSKNSCNFSN